MTGNELFEQYMAQTPEELPQFLKSLTWEDVTLISEEMTKRAKAIRASGDTDAVLDLVTKSIPFLEYFENK